MGLLTTALVVLLMAVISLASVHEGEHHRRSYTIGPGKVLFCPSPRAGPPGPPGPPGLPGRDGRDGRDCPPCNCGSSGSIPPPPPVEQAPCSGGGGGQVPMPQAPPGGEYHPHKRGGASDIGDQRDQASSGDNE